MFMWSFGRRCNAGAVLIIDLPVISSMFRHSDLPRHRASRTFLSGLATQHSKLRNTFDSGLSARAADAHLPGAHGFCVGGLSERFARVGSARAEGGFGWVTRSLKDLLKDLSRGLPGVFLACWFGASCVYRPIMACISRLGGVQFLPWFRVDTWYSFVVRVLLQSQSHVDASGGF